MGSLKKSLKKTVLALCLSLALSGGAQAQTVTVEGTGVDKDSAIKDASRLAVEQAVGTLIDSRTLMKDLVIELDEIAKKSQGFIRKITVLDEGQRGGVYRVKAAIDVDTEPNAALVDNLTMLMRLNDPRIAVVILNGWNDDNGKVSHNDDLESALNAKLIELNFTHIIDADHVIKLFGADFLNNIYEGNKGLYNGKSDNACEFLVLGKVTSNTMNIAIPDHRTGQMVDAPLNNTKAKLNLKVIKYDTGDIIGTFLSERAGIGANTARAFDTAIAPMATESAEKLANIFKGFSAKSNQGGIRITINAPSAQAAENLVNAIKNLQDVDNVHIRSQAGGKFVVDVETAQKPHAIVQMLRSRVKQNIATEKATANSIDIRLL